MLKSMTGFGQNKSVFGSREITVEIKSVNSRYLDLNVKVPKMFSFLEENVKKEVMKVISRGKVEVYVSIADKGDDAVTVTPNYLVINGYLEALRELKQGAFAVEQLADYSLVDVLKLPETVTISKEVADPDEIVKEVNESLQSALSDFSAMRRVEGERLCADLCKRGRTIGKMVDFVEKRSPDTVSEYREKLKARMEELLGKGEYTDQRILAEAAVMADKVSVTEEIVRLRSHLIQLEKLLNANEPNGRKLDFLIQEINRETNTIGSKANDYEIAKTVVEMKSEIEKIREQIQNLE